VRELSITQFKLKYTASTLGYIWWLATRVFDSGFTTVSIDALPWPDAITLT
jgi:ABC-type polysaccharide/polyol phosphate export permease